MSGDLLLAAVPAAFLPAREQMAFTLAFHLLLVPLGVCLPLITLVMNWIAIRRKDAIAFKLARRWSVVMAIQFAVGAVTGTVLSFEFGLLWPRMMGRFGDVFGIGFGVEAWAFFIEAIFIAIYLFGWKRLSPTMHFVTGIPVPIAGFLGAFGIIAANSWMNTPAGFTLGPDGEPTNVNVVQAVFTPSFGYEYWHFMFAMYVTAGFVVASVYAVGWLRGRRDRYHRLGFMVPFSIAVIALPIQLLAGDTSARAVSHDQPAKFAAMEITWTTRSHNPEYLFGFLTPKGKVLLAVPVPSGDSILVGFSPKTVVQGLTAFPSGSRPSVLDANIVHWAFDVMAFLGPLFLLLALWFVVALIRHRNLPRSLWFFRAAALAGVAAYLCDEAGWVTTEVGRQPWIVYNVMRVTQAVTDASAGFVWVMFGLLFVVYITIGIVFLSLLLRLSAQWRRADLGLGTPVAEPERSMPYGPREETFAGGEGGP